MSKVSIIITSWNEPNTIGHAIECIGNKAYSGVPEDYEIIQSSPDDLTLEIGKAKATELGILDHFIQVKDPLRGKPNGLMEAIKASTGDIIIMTDGDVYFGENTIKELVLPFADETVGGVSGRPVSADGRNTMMSYFGHLLSDRIKP